MKQRMCSLFLALVLLLSLAVPAAAAGTMPFTDVKESDWFYSYVKTMYDNELVSGTTPTTFSPQDTVTLGEALKFILNAAGYTAPTTSGKNWASGSYQLAQEKGFLNSSWSLGLNDAAFLPSQRELVEQAIDHDLTFISARLRSATIVIAPYFPSLEIGPRFQAIHRLVHERATSVGLTSTDALTTAINGDEDRLAIDGIHPDDAGHAQMARAMISFYAGILPST